MPEDASLDQFVSGGESDSEGDESETEATENEAAEIAQAVSTYRWSPEGGECADCGESVERRWRAEGQQDGDLVCPNCKDW